MKKFLTLSVAVLMTQVLFSSVISAQTSDSSSPFNDVAYGQIPDSASVAEDVALDNVSDAVAVPGDSVLEQAVDYLSVETETIDEVALQQDSLVSSPISLESGQAPQVGQTKRKKKELTSPKTTEVFFPHRNQLSLSYGDGYAYPFECLVLEAVGTAIGTALAAPFIIMFGGKPEDIDINVGDLRTHGIVSFGYRHFLPKDRFALGFDVSYSKVQRSFENSSTAEDGTVVKERTVTNSDLFYVSFGATCYYKRSGWCKLYGSADIGIVASPALHDAMSIYQRNFGFAYDLTPIGIQMGNDTVSGFAALSVGYKGFLSVGVRVSL